MTTRSWRWLAVVPLFAACADSTTGPSSSIPAAILLRETAVHVESLGDTVRLTAEVMDVNGRPIPGAPIRWRLDGNTVLQPTADAGTFIAIGNGEVNAWAELGDMGGVIRPDTGYLARKASRVVSVRVAQRPRELTLTGPSVLWAVGATARLAANIRDGRGAPITGAAVTAWTSSDPYVVSVDAAGVVRALRDGTATIEANVDGLRRSVTIRVAARIQLSVCATAANVTVPACVTLENTAQERAP